MRRGFRDYVSVLWNFLFFKSWILEREERGLVAVGPSYLTVLLNVSQSNQCVLAFVFYTCPCKHARTRRRINMNWSRVGVSHHQSCFLLNNSKLLQNCVVIMVLAVIILFEWRCYVLASPWGLVTDLFWLLQYFLVGLRATSVLSRCST